MAYLGRRRVLGVLVVLLAAVAVLRHHHPVGPIAPVAPGALAIAVNGNLLIADRARHEVLERMPGEGFVVAVGNGVGGEGGDGSSALHASIDAPTSMAVGPDGALYFAQPVDGGIASSVVREVVPDGAITTVVGRRPSCRARGASARSIPAQDAQLAAPALAIGIGGGLEIAGLDCAGTLDGGPLLAFAAGGRLVEAAHDGALVAARCDPDALAISRAGTVAVACGGQTKETLLIKPDGAVRAYPGIAASGLASEPGGAFAAIVGDAVIGLSAAGARPTVELGPGSSGGRRLGTGESMAPDGITTDRHGDIYLASIAGPGRGDFTGVVEVDPAGRLTVLWRGSRRR
jgi:hypothetical protein